MNYEIIETFKDKNSRNMTTFKCEKHGIRTMETKNFKRVGCPKCNLDKVRNEKYVEFKKYVESVSTTKLLSTEYINSTTKMLFECECKNIFERDVVKFKTRGAHKCRECSIKSMIDKQKNDYNYVKDYISESTNCILLSTNYKNQRQKLSLLCGCGEEFITDFDSIKNKNKIMCNKCSKDKTKESLKFSYEEVLDIVNKSGNKLLSKEYENNSIKLDLECSCGEIHYKSLSQIRCGWTLCEKCLNKLASQGERIIHKYLDENNIKYKTQYRFKDCINKYTLPFDVCVFDRDNIKALIEYDGEFHYIPKEFVGGIKALKESQFRDNIKTTYCKENDIKLIRIPYFEKNNIENILRENDIV